MTISAKIIAHSRSYLYDKGVPDLFTLELTYPRFIHAEFMTHRMFSRNASSSRAIPVARKVASVLRNPAIPLSWGKNKLGMQATELIPLEDEKAVTRTWLSARQIAVSSARALEAYEVHKQITNRLIEPWDHITVVVTATEWYNFFLLRDNAAAQPEIHALAQAIREAQRSSTPDILSRNEWHKPYALNDDLRTSVAGCARVSYDNHDGTNREVSSDCVLADKLLAAGHMSPFEHQATPMTALKSKAEPHVLWDSGVTHTDRETRFWSGNFRGWIQYRQVL